MPQKGFTEIVRDLRSNRFKIAYDIMDDWGGFKNLGQASWYKQETEENLILDSDFVIAVNNHLHDKFLHLRKDVEVIGNGVNEKTISEYKFIAGTTASNQKRVAGYVGWLTESRFDWEFLFSLSKDNPDVEFQLIGYGLSSSVKNKLNNYKNIKFIGKVHPDKLWLYVRNWHIGFIPFVDDEISYGSDPLKVYQFITFGLPTIVKGCKSIADYALIFYVDNLKKANAMLKKFDKSEKIVQYREEMKTQIENFIEKACWKNRVLTIEKIMSKPTLWS